MNVDDLSLGEGSITDVAFEVALVAMVLEEGSGALRPNAAARALGLDLAGLRKSSEAGVTDMRVVDASGGVRTFSVEWRPLRGGYLWCIQDVTNARALEEELLHLRRVDSIGAITASVVHDFNNLLTPLLCTSQLLAAELDATTSAGALAGELKTAAHRSAGLVQRVLSLARRQPVVPRPTNIAEAVSDARWLIERLASDRVAVTLDLATEPLHAVADPNQLQDAILNLVANARDAMPNGGRLTIRVGSVILGDGGAAAADGPGGHFVAIGVSDTGLGMSPAVRDRLFERFFTTKTEGRGTGLGLSAVKRFVTGCRGCMAVRSEVGVGTAVVLYLPLCRPSLAPQMAPSAMCS